MDIFEFYDDIISPSIIMKITFSMRDCIFGLRKRTHDSANIKMLPSYVTNTIIELETPKTYLALDLGGTNFRVIIVEIVPPAVCKIDSKIYKIPVNLMKDDGAKLFDHLASCISDFIQIKKVNIPDTVEGLPIGFTFSFPCSQKSLDSSTLLYWTKGFSAPGVEGQDIGQMLNDAIKRSSCLVDFKVHVSAICNDTVGTLMSCVFEDPDCQIGLIVGTGSNACYMEKTEKIECISQLERNKSEQMIINTEWGNFGANGVLNDIVSLQDSQVDTNSPNPGRQIFEKMISGMYLGELVRLILIQLNNCGVVFFGEDISTIKEIGAFETSLVSLILSCGEDDIMEIQNLIAYHLEIGAVAHDCQVVRYVCSVISKRAAMLCACGVAGIAYMIAAPDQRVSIDPSLLGSPSTAIAVDGNSQKNSKNASPTPSRQLSTTELAASSADRSIDSERALADSSASLSESSVSESIGNKLYGKKQRIVCGVDGTVYRKHPTFAKHLKEYTSLLVPKNVELEYVLSHDGSGKGAALTALTNGSLPKRKPSKE